MNATKTLNLEQFTGTEQYYKHVGILYTDGVKHLAEEAGAYWLIDAIASWQISPKVKRDSMLQQIQFWKLRVKPDNSAVLTCERDEDDIVLTQEIPYTDFPLESVTLYLTNRVLMLPSEY
jgi:hypothetical protein